MESELKVNIEKLLEQQISHCVSIYIPTNVANGDVKGNMIRFKNAVNEAKKQLAYLNKRQTFIGFFLAPLYSLLEEEDFWWHMDQGLAVFLSSSLFLHYKVPVNFIEHVSVNSRFYLKPLLHLLTNKLQYSVLALDLNHIKLYRYTPYNSTEIPLTDIPVNIEDALQYDTYEKHMNFHTGIPSSGASRGLSVFHASGGGTDSNEREHKERVWNFFIKLESSLQPLLHREANPLLLVGVDHQLAIYREINKYPHLLPFELHIAPHDLKPVEMHERVKEFMNMQMEKQKLNDIERYQILRPRQLASGNIRQILPAAQAGKIETLFVSDSMHIWGRYHAETGSVHLEEEFTPYNQELTDVATFYTLKNNGYIYNLAPEEMPEPTAIAAIYRY
jgi:hypothetical protein